MSLIDRHIHQARVRLRQCTLTFARTPGVNSALSSTSSTETRPQVRISFDSKEEAVAFAVRQGIAFKLEEPQLIALRPKSYAENFKFGRLDRWTH